MIKNGGEMTPSEEWNGKKDKKNRSKEDENQFIYVTKKKIKSIYSV